MKIKVELVLEVDPEGFRAEYNSDEKADEIRASIRYQVGEHVAHSLQPFDFVKSVEVKE